MVYFQSEKKYGNPHNNNFWHTCNTLASSLPVNPHAGYDGLSNVDQLPIHMWLDKIMFSRSKFDCHHTWFLGKTIIPKSQDDPPEYSIVFVLFYTFIYVILTYFLPPIQGLHATISTTYVPKVPKRYIP